VVLHETKDFADISKNLAINTDLKFCLDHQNNYVERSSVDNVAKNFNILATSLNVLYLIFSKIICLCRVCVKFRFVNFQGILIV